ncbi:MAG TPA: hypothetical protein VNT75_15685 [Symbiobacteriaceae bacterium]|nr:hypothetical protein [Symbiobacteriaceae bacterium]
MLTDAETLSRELAALMQAHNRWTARVARLQRQTGEPAAPQTPALKYLEEQLALTSEALAQARSQAADWEQKARHLSQQLYKERSERSRRIRELEDELRRRSEQGSPR